MSEKLFEFLIIEFFGITIVGGIFVAYLTDGTMPKRRWIGLLISTLIIIIGVCVYFKVPVLPLVLEFIVNVPWFITVYVASLCACIIVAIYKSAKKRSLSPLLCELGAILIGTLGMLLFSVLTMGPVELIGLITGALEIEGMLYVALFSALFGGLASGISYLLDLRT